MSLLEALQAAWLRLRQRRAIPLGRADRFRKDQVYVQRIHGAAEEEPPSGPRR